MRHDIKDEKGQVIAEWCDITGAIRFCHWIDNIETWGNWNMPKAKPQLLNNQEHQAPARANAP